MQIAVFAYDHMTALDAVGPYEILSRLPGAETIVVGEERGPVRCDTQRLTLMADGKLLLVNDNDFGIAGDTTRFVIVEGADIGPR